jgi:hypothetical protein
MSEPRVLPPDHNPFVEALKKPAHAHDWEACDGSYRWVESDKRKRVRCPVCNRRLLPYAEHCIGGEFISYRIPRHKNR